MINEDAGRLRSTRTAEELEEQLRKEMGSLSDEERAALEVLLAELRTGNTTGLYNALVESEYKTKPVSMEQFVKDPYYLGNTCENIYPKILEDLTELFSGGYHEAIFTGCIDLDALIQSSNGSLKTIREWIGSKGEVLGFHPSGTRSAPTGKAKHSGVQPTLRLTLANGMEQRLTPDHRVVVWRDEYKWIPVSEVEIGDFVVVPRRIRTTPDSDLSEVEAKLLAYWCTDGSSSERRSRFDDGNPATSLEVVELLNALGFSGKRTREGNCWEVYVEEHKRSGFLSWLRKNEGHHKTEEVRVPDVVCRASDSVVAAFLNRVWAAEGCVYSNPDVSPPRFTLGMTSERFVRQVQLLLLRFGIQSRLAFTPQFDKRTGKTTDTWFLAVSGCGPLKRFLDSIGPILGKEQKCAEIAEYVGSRRANTNVDVLPIERRWLSRRMTEEGLTRSAESRWWDLSRGSGVYLSRQMFDEWLAEFGSTDFGRRLALQFPSDFGFERVKELSDGGSIEVGDVCDVADVHSFISNGIYSHNSIGWGKCVHPDTEVFDVTSGCRRRVGDVGEFSVASMTEQGKIVSRPAKAFSSGTKPCLKLTLAGGQSIVLSHDHPVFTARGWIQASQVTLDDLVATPRSLPEPEAYCSVSDDEVKLAAFLLADGGCTNNITFTNETVEVLDEFAGLVRELGKPFRGQDPDVSLAASQNAGKATTLNVRGVMGFVQRFGLDAHSRDKRLPAEFYGLRKEQAALFLNRFWACDGSVSPKAPQKAEVTLASERMVDDLRFLLLRLGVHARKYAKEKFYRTPEGEKRCFPAWSLTVTGATNLLAFLDAVGPVLGKESACAALRDACTAVKPNTNTDVVPVGLKELREIRDELGEAGKGVTQRFGCPDGQLLGRERFQRLCAEYGYKGRYAYLAQTDLLWEKVRAVEDQGEHEVFDLSVEETHSFVGNGIVVHNTFAASVGVCRVLYELSCLHDPYKTLGIATGTNISLVCLSVNEQLATKVAFENIATKIKASPYFQTHFPFEPTKKELRFPSSIWVAARATTDTSSLGLNVIGGLLDECLTAASKVLLGDGSEVTAGELFARGLPFEVTTFDFRTNIPVRASAFIRRSTDQECLELRLDDGLVMQASADHPVAVRREGRLKFIAMSAIRDGDEVVTYGRWASDSTRGSQSDVRQVSVRGTEAAHRGSEQEPEVVQGCARADVCAADREGGSHREGRLPVSGTYFHDESGVGQIPILLRASGNRDARSRPFSRWIHLRKAGSPLYLAGVLALDVAGLSSSAAWWLGERGRSEFSGVHVQCERARQDERRSALLQGARLGVRGLGRTLAVARVVSKRSLGVQATYDVSVPGYEVFVADGVLVHNTNFMPTKGKDAARYGSVDHAEVIYNSIQRRMKSRFQKKGKLPGMLFVVSSKKTSEDFTARRIKQSRGDPAVFVRDYALWDVKRENYSDKVFHVIVGNEQTPSKILDEVEVAALKVKKPENTTLLEVPDDFRADFEADLEGSIRDLAGCATVAISPFIQRREKIYEAVEQDKQTYGPNRHPFSTISYDPSKGGTFIWEKMIRDTEERQMPGVSSVVRRPIINPHAPRHIHIDPALRNDALGFCMAHIAGWKDVIRRSDQGTQYMERAPVYVVDLVLQVIPPPGEEIILGDVRRIIYELHAHGYMITHVSLDSFQSRDTLQQLQQKGYAADLVSVDTSMEPYETLKTALYENRLFVYEYPPLIKELQQLEKDAVRRKVDHPPRGSKDVADALAGVCYTLNTFRAHSPLPMLRGVSVYGDAWMPEQRQAMMAGDGAAGLNTDLREYGMLPPIFVGSKGGGDGF